MKEQPWRPSYIPLLLNTVWGNYQAIFCEVDWICIINYCHACFFFVQKYVFNCIQFVFQNTHCHCVIFKIINYQLLPWPGQYIHCQILPQKNQMIVLLILCPANFHPPFSLRSILILSHIHDRRVSFCYGNNHEPMYVYFLGFSIYIRSKS